MKKTCKNCKADRFYGHLPGLHEPCMLGFDTDGKGHPTEECPKPLSWKEFDRAAYERPKKREILRQ